MRLKISRNFRRLIGCFALLALLLAGLFWLISDPKVATIKLQHGYAMAVYRDMDVGGDELYYSLTGPGKNIDGLFLAFTSSGNPVPHFTAHVTKDGEMGWVTADTQPTVILFMIDYKGGSAGHYMGPAEIQMGYLARIDAAEGKNFHLYANESIDQGTGIPGEDF